MKRMKILYLGYDFFYPILEYFTEDKTIEILAIYTKEFDPDDTLNLNIKTKEVSDTYGIPYKTTKITYDEIKFFFENKGCELLISAAYPYKIPIVDVKNFKGINIHPSMLPYGRGRWPLPKMILDNSEYAGVTIHKLNEYFDSGDIILQKNINISDNENLETLSFKIRFFGLELIKELFNNFNEYWEKAVKQGKGSYWKMPDLPDYTIDFNCNVQDIDKLSRAYGKAGVLFKYKDKDIWVASLSCFEQEHSFPPGQVIFDSGNGEYMIAAKNGMVCIRHIIE